MSVILYIVFTYTLFSYVHITSFQFLYVNQQDVPVRYLAPDPCLCPNYYLFPFLHPFLPASIMLGAISIDVM